jgi:hypothetical protein
MAAMLLLLEGLNSFTTAPPAHAPPCLWVPLQFITWLNCPSLEACC